MAITFRIPKGYELTHTELDDNFRYLHEWKSNTPYKVGMYVTNGFVLYECITAHISTMSFEVTLWKAYLSSGSNGIKYVWNSFIEQGLVSGHIDGDRGIRNDIVGRPVYEYDSGVWAVVHDPTNIARIYYLDGGAKTSKYVHTLLPSVGTVSSMLDKVVRTRLNVNPPATIIDVTDNENLVFHKDYYNKGTINISEGSGDNDFGSGIAIPTYATMVVEGVLVNEGDLIIGGMLIT